MDVILQVILHNNVNRTECHRCSGEVNDVGGEEKLTGMTRQKPGEKKKIMTRPDSYSNGGMSDIYRH